MANAKQKKALFFNGHADLSGGMLGTQNKIGDEGAEIVSAFLQTDVYLYSLNLSNAKLTDVGGLKIAEALKHNTTLGVLKMKNKELTDATGDAILAAIAVHPALVVVDLGKLKKKEIKAALKHPDRAALDFQVNACAHPESALVRCQRGDAVSDLIENGKHWMWGPKHFVASGPVETPAGKLGKKDKKAKLMRNAGVDALATALRVDDVRTTVILDGQSISDYGAACLGEMLKYNTTITKLSLKGNWIGDRGVLALAQGVSQNGVIKSIDVSGQMVQTDKKAVKALKAALKSKTRAHDASLREAWQKTYDALDQSEAMVTKKADRKKRAAAARSAARKKQGAKMIISVLASYIGLPDGMGELLEIADGAFDGAFDDLMSSAMDNAMDAATGAVVNKAVGNADDTDNKVDETHFDKTPEEAEAPVEASPEPATEESKEPVEETDVVEESKEQDEIVEESKEQDEIVEESKEQQADDAVAGEAEASTTKADTTEVPDQEEIPQE